MFLLFSESHLKQGRVLIVALQGKKKAAPARTVRLLLHTDKAAFSPSQWAADEERRGDAFSHWEAVLETQMQFDFASSKSRRQPKTCTLRKGAQFLLSLLFCKRTICCCYSMGEKKTNICLSYTPPPYSPTLYHSAAFTYFYLAATISFNTCF